MFGVGPAELIVVAIVVAIVIARRKPALLVVAGGGLLAAMLLLSAVFFFRIAQPEFVSIATPNSAIQITSGPTIAHDGPHPMPISQAFDVPNVRLSLAGLIVVSLVIIGGLWLISRLANSPRHDTAATGGEPWHEDSRRGGWIWGLGLIGLVIFLGLFGVRFYSRADMHHRAAEMRERVQREIAQTEKLNAQLQSGKLRAEQSIEKAIEAFERPRIALDSKSVEAPQPAASGSTDQTPATSDDGTKKLPFEEVVKILEDPTAAQDAAYAATQHDHTDTHTHAATAEVEQGPSPTPASNANRPSATINLTTAAKTDLVLIQFDAEKLKSANLTFHEASVRLFESMGGVGLIRVNAGQRRVFLAVDTARQIAVNQYKFTKDGSTVPLQNVATLRILSADSADGPRPAWVNQSPPRTGGVLTEILSVGDYSTIEECRAESDKLMQMVICDHIESLVPAAASSWGSGFELRRDGKGRIEFSNGVYTQLIPRSLEQMDIGPDYIRHQLVPKGGEYIETVERSVGPMKRLYTRLEFTPEIDAQLKERWVAHEQEWRVKKVGVSGVGVVSLVLLAWGLLKVDTATKGYYSKRLFLGVPAVIIGLLFLLSLVAA